MLLSKQASGCVSKVAQSKMVMGKLGLAQPQTLRGSAPVPSSAAPSHRMSSVVARAAAAKTIGKAAPVKVEDGPAIMDDIDCVIFDCDGEDWVVRVCVRSGEGGAGDQLLGWTLLHLCV